MLFKEPTILASARYLTNQAEASTLSSIEVIPRDMPIPLSFAQERLWFLDQLEPGNDQYNIPMTLRLTGHLEVDALEKVIKYDSVPT